MPPGNTTKRISHQTLHKSGLLCACKKRTIQKCAVDIRHHGTNITCAILLLDRVDILSAGFIKVLVVTLVDGVNLATRRQFDLQSVSYQQICPFFSPLSSVVVVLTSGCVMMNSPIAGSKVKPLTPLPTDYKLRG